MAKVRCPNPNCRKVSLLPDAYTGRRVRCKGCGTQFTATPLTGQSAEISAEGDVIPVGARRVGVRPTPPPLPPSVNSPPPSAPTVLPEAPAPAVAPRAGGGLVYLAAVAF